MGERKDLAPYRRIGMIVHSDSNVQPTACSQPKPKVLLTSNGLTTPELKTVFHETLRSGTRYNGAAMTVGYIPTAVLAPSGTSKKSPGEQRRRNRQEAKRRAKSLGKEMELLVKTVDLAEVRGAQLEDELGCVDCLYVDGGNTFWLLYHLQQSGFDKLARRMVLEDGVLYVGRSAGAIVSGQTASTALWKGWDDPSVVPLDTTDPQQLLGIGLLPCSVFPHYSEKWEQLVAEKAPTLAHELVQLTDFSGELWVSGKRQIKVEAPGNNNISAKPEFG